MSNDLKAVFREGALEFLQELEQALLHLEENPDNTAEIDRMFRVMHTIKGSAAMVELNDVAKFAHTLESECDYIRQGHTRVTADLIKMTLKAHDHILEMIDAHFDGDPVSAEKSAEFLQKFKEVRMASTSSLEKGKYGTNRLFGIMEKILLELELCEEITDKMPTLYSVGSSITQLYFFCQILNKESPVEFLDEFEKVYRHARTFRQKLPDEIVSLTAEVMNEVYNMLNEAPPDEMSFDPDIILKALQRPMELRERLNKIAGELISSKAPLPPPLKYRIKISASDRGPGATSGEERFINMLERLGELGKISKSDSTAETLILQMTADS